MAIKGENAEVTSPHAGGATGARHSRRQLLRMLAWGGASALLTACGPATTRTGSPGTAAPTGAQPSSTPPAPLPTSPSAGGFELNGATLPYDRRTALIVDRASYSNFDNFNMYTEGAEFGAGYFQQAVEYLWYINYATGETMPWLATGYLYNEDYTELTIKLRPNVTWNDGQPFTADDVAFTMTMLRDNPARGRTARAAVWQTISVQDPSTVRITFTEPQPRGHQEFFCKSTPGLVVQPKHIWEQHNPKTFKNNPPITTGPWMLERTDPQAKLFIWKRNDNYWNKANLPQPRHLIYRAAASGERALQEAIAGVSDSFEGIDFNTYTNYANELTHLRQVTYMDPCPRGLQFNRSRPSRPMTPPRCRSTMQRTTTLCAPVRRCRSSRRSPQPIGTRGTGTMARTSKISTRSRLVGGGSSCLSHCGCGLAAHSVPKPHPGPRRPGGYRPRNPAGVSGYIHGPSLRS